MTYDHVIPIHFFVHHFNEHSLAMCQLWWYMSYIIFSNMLYVASEYEYHKKWKILVRKNMKSEVAKLYTHGTYEKYFKPFCWCARSCDKHAFRYIQNIHIQMLKKKIKNNIYLLKLKIFEQLSIEKLRWLLRFNEFIWISCSNEEKIMDKMREQQLATNGAYSTSFFE